jgi:hypothetical protein
MPPGKITEYNAEWQWPISGVHSIMMEKSALAGDDGGCTPTPFHSVFNAFEKFILKVYTANQ